MFPGTVLASKVVQTSIAIVRIVYIYCDNVCRLCKKITILFVLIVMIGVLAALPYVVTSSWNGQHSTLLSICINGSQSSHNATWQELADDPSIFVFLGTYYIIFLATVIIDIACYVQIIRYIKKTATQVAVILVTPAERKKGRNVITAPANLLIWLISLVCIAPSTLLQTNFLLTAFHKHEEDLGFEGYHYATICCLSVVVPMLTIGSSADLRQDIIKLRKIFCHKCNHEAGIVEGGGDVYPNVELSFAPGGERAGVYAISENTGEYSS